MISLLFRYTGCFTMDVIALTAFGLKLDAQKDPNNPFVVEASKVFAFSLFNLGIMLACEYITCTLFSSTPQLDNRQLRWWNITFYCMLEWRNCISHYVTKCITLYSILGLNGFKLQGSDYYQYIYCGLHNLAKIVHTLVCLEFASKRLSLQ